MQETRNAVIAERPGSLGEVLGYRPVGPLPPLTGSEVDVRMVASTINPSDAVTVSGAYASRTTFPFVPGFEGVGVIDRVGPDVPQSALGTRVLPIGTAGDWQQIKRTDHSWCVPVPADLSDDIACYAYINPLTAWLMVDRFCLPSTTRVAVTAATSTIAGHIAELLSLRGIAPIAVTRGTPVRTAAGVARWSTTISTSDPDWSALLDEETSGRGVDVVFDAVGGAQGAELLERLAPGGRLVHYGLLSGEPLPPACFSGADGKGVELFRLRDVIHGEPRERLPELFAPVFAQLRSGRLRTVPTKTVPLALLPESVSAEGASVGGKLLIRCDG